MGELREQMRRGERSAPPDDDMLVRLVDRKRRRARNGRVASAAVALAVTGGLVAGGLVVLNHRGPEGRLGGQGPGTSGSSVGTTGTGPGATTGPATTAAAGSGLVAGPGQFYYWKFAVVYGGGVANMTYWWSPEGTGRMVNSVTGDGFGVPADGALRVGKFPVGDDLSDLSTDPSKLLPQLIERSSDRGESPRPDVTPAPGQRADTGRLVSAVEDLLSEWAPHASPELRVGLYEVLHGLPSVEDLGSIADPTGRAAVALRVTLDVSQKTFWFDPDTHLFLAEEEAIDPDAAPQLSGDTSPTYVIVESAGIVGDDRATPTGDQEIVPEAGDLPSS